LDDKDLKEDFVKFVKTKKESLNTEVSSKETELKALAPKTESLRLQ
jgi:hypothetical protein